jgi:hypothetical protein
MSEVREVRSDFDLPLNYNGRSFDVHLKPGDLMTLQKSGDTYQFLAMDKNGNQQTVALSSTQIWNHFGGVLDDNTLQLQAEGLTPGSDDPCWAGRSRFETDPKNLLQDYSAGTDGADAGWLQIPAENCNSRMAPWKKAPPQISLVTEETPTTPSHIMHKVVLEDSHKAVFIDAKSAIRTHRSCPERGRVCDHIEPVAAVEELTCKLEKPMSKNQAQEEFDANLGFCINSVDPGHSRRRKNPGDKGNPYDDGVLQTAVSNFPETAAAQLEKQGPQGTSKGITVQDYIDIDVLARTLNSEMAGCALDEEAMRAAAMTIYNRAQVVAKTQRIIDQNNRNHPYVGAIQSILSPDMRAVQSVQNRFTKGSYPTHDGDSFAAVVLANKQYSVWNQYDSLAMCPTGNSRNPGRPMDAGALAAWKKAVKIAKEMVLNPKEFEKSVAGYPKGIYEFTSAVTPEDQTSLIFVPAPTVLRGGHRVPAFNSRCEKLWKNTKATDPDEILKKLRVDGS